MMQPFKKVIEASYLTVDKAWSYRAILRYFYIQHERMREFLFPEEVYEHLMSLQGFGDYTEEQLHQDLDQLVRWNNLIARQETGRARTIEEFKKKRFRYQCTPYTVEFERMLQEMEKGGESFGGSLEKKEFERLYQALLEVEKIVRKNTPLPSPDECAQIWNDVFTYFRSITKNTSDYIAHINSEEAEERMQTEAFLVFKDQFTTYLRDFIIELQQTALKIQQLLKAIDLQTLNPLIEQVIVHQQQVPRFEDIPDEKELIPAEQDKWNSLYIWFLGNEHGESELDMLQIRTNEQIRRITRVVQRLGERHHYFRSRKKDYLHLAKWFDSFADVKEAHKLSAVVFGVFHTRHLFSDHVPTDDIYTSIWEEKPMEYETNPRIRNYREKTRPGAIISQQKQKEEAKREHLQNKQIEQQTLEKYMQGNEIHLDQLPVVEPYVRKMLLSWIGKAMMRKDRTFQTEHGRVVKVIMSSNERITLRAADGDMEMPKVTFKFVEEVNV